MLSFGAFWPLVCALATCMSSVCFAAGIGYTSFQPNSVGLAGVCQGSLACSLIGSTWPDRKHFNCGDITVSDTSFMSARQYMMVGAGKSISKSSTSWPSSVASDCQKSNVADRYAYTNGIWTAYYTIAMHCGCPGAKNTAMPNCTAARSQNSKACNVAQFTFCAMRLNGVTCTY